MRKRLPPRLYQRSDGVWVIRDGKRTRGTGTRSERGSDAPQEALTALSEYLAAKAAPVTGPKRPDQLKIGHVLALYAQDKGPHMAPSGRETLSYSIEALSPFWADLTCDAVKGSTCRKYAAQRIGAGRSPSTPRRELAYLQAALNHAHSEGTLIYPVKVTLPEKAPPRDRWLTRDEVRRLLRASPPHLRRFIIVAVLTGTRNKALLALRWTPSVHSGWADVENGIIHRQGSREVQTNKRRGSVRMTQALQRLMRRWAREGGSHVVMRHGKPILSVKKALMLAQVRAKIEGVSPHVFKHTAVTWAFQRGMSLEDAADYFATTSTTLETVYRHHSPYYQDRAAEVMGRRK